MKRFLRRVVFFGVCVFLSCGFSNCQPFHKRVFSEAGLLKADSEELRRTVITAHLEEPIRPGKNVLWCSTFQLVWNEVCELIGEDIHFDKDPPMVPILNKKKAGKSDLDDASYVALAGFIRDGILNRIPSELNRKFKGQAYGRLIPSGSGLRPQDIVGYSYLFKNLDFPRRFERLSSGMQFAGTRVACFGVGEDFKRSQIGMYEQVTIVSYVGKDDFIIELKTKSKGDQVILAKTAASENLEQTILRVLDLTAKAGEEKMLCGDILMIPKLNFDVRRKYSELMLLRLKAENPAVAKDLRVLAATQDIRFQMDEKGVKLRSEAHITLACSAPERPRPQHILIFDKPFLILLKRTHAQRPYFVLWVDNPELLVGKKQAENDGTTNRN